MYLRNRTAVLTQQITSQKTSLQVDWIQDKNISRKSYNCLIREIYNKFLLQSGVSYKRVYDCFLVLKHLLVESHFKDKRITYYLLFIFTFVTSDKLNRTGFNA